jgi:hypothetical protein
MGEEEANGNGNGNGNGHGGGPIKPSLPPAAERSVPPEPEAMAETDAEPAPVAKRRSPAPKRTKPVLRKGVLS